MMRVGLRENFPLSREPRVPKGHVPEPQGHCRAKAGNLVVGVLLSTTSTALPKTFKQKDLCLTKHCFFPSISSITHSGPSQSQSSAYLVFLTQEVAFFV